MADAPEHNGGRPTGNSQSHDHEKRDRSYSFQSGGTVQGGIDTAEAPPGKGTRNYVANAHAGGNNVNATG